MSLILHFHPLASYCWKVLIALYESEMPFTAHVVEGDAQSRADFEAIWPMAKFPVLEDRERGRIVPESSILIEYLALRYPAARALVPTNEDLALETRAWDRFFDVHVHNPMQKIVGDRLRARDAKDATGVAEARQTIRKAYSVIQGGLGGRTWANGADFSLADCSAFPALFYADRVEPIGRDHGAVSAYLLRLMERPSVQRVLDEAEPYFKFFPTTDV